MKKDKLQQLQTRKLKALLTHAYENVPYYHASFKKSGFRPADLTRLEDLHKIPVLRRSDLRCKTNELFARNIGKKEAVLCKTSGTTATPVEFYRGKMDIYWDMAAQLRGYGWAGYETGSKLVYIRLFEPNDVLGDARHRLERLITRWRLLGGYELSEESIESYCSRMRNFKPDYVHGGAGPTNILATFLLENDQYSMRPKAVFTYGETLLPNYRKTIEKAFRSKIHDWYGSTETAYISGQCGQNECHHVTDENVLLEVEKDGEPAVPGEEGEVFLTNLNSLAMPFIRYDIGDLGKTSNDDCPCGRGLSLFTPIGRTYEYFAHSNGTFTFLRDLHTVFEDLPIRDFQVIQPSYDRIIIRILPKTGYTKTHTNFILKNASLIISDIVKVKVELADSIPLTGFGKIPHFVSKIPTKYTQRAF